jgi:hypothetical protein
MKYFKYFKLHFYYILMKNVNGLIDLITRQARDNAKKDFENTFLF